MMLWFLNIRHSDTLFGMWFLTLAQQLFLLILPSIGWICRAHRKRYNSSHVYCQAKGLSKKSYKNFLNDLKKVFKMVWWRGRKWNNIKRVFEVEAFSSSQNIDFPFYLKRFLKLFSLFFSILFLPLSLSLSFSMLHLLRTWGFWWY
jgi:hypothetical protein